MSTTYVNYQIVTPSRVTGPVFMGVLWGTTLMCLFLLGFRLVARFHYFGRMYIDDFFAISAWVLLLVQAIIWQTQVDAMYAQYQITLGNIAATPEVLRTNANFMRAEVAILYMFYGSLWSVKLSFFLFFWRLCSRIRSYRIALYCIFAFTASSCIVSMGDIQYWCLLSSQEWIAVNCVESKAILYEYNTFYANFALDVFSDLLIIAIPVCILWEIRIPTRQKIILISIFALSIVVIAFAVVRVSVVVRSGENADIAWLWLWSFLETVAANVVASVASFRQLYRKQESTRPNAQAHAWSNSARRKNLFPDYFFSRKQSKTPNTLSSFGNESQVPMDLLENRTNQGTREANLPAAAPGCDWAYDRINDLPVRPDQIYVRSDFHTESRLAGLEE